MAHLLKKTVLAAGACMALSVLAQTAVADEVFKDGADVYANICGRCHEPGIGPTIKGRQLPPEFIKAVVRHGLFAMPAFPAAYISDEKLQQVAEYVSTAPAPEAKP